MIIVTGAASGIGRATALALGRADCPVLLCDRDGGGIEETAAMIRAKGGLATSHAIDLAEAGAAAEMVAATRNLRAIVHSAGLFPQLSFSATSLADFDRVMAVNLRCAFVLARSGADAMADGGSLIFLTSGSGLPDAVRDPFQSRFALYGASKAALDRLALGIAAELAEQAIAVTTITPGAFVATRGTAGLDLSAAGDLGTIEADDVGRAVAWLAREPRMGLAGHRLSATGFGVDWGPGL